MLRFHAMVRTGMCLLLLSLNIQLACAENRVALVVGNAKYAEVDALDNPERDATLIAAKLRSVGFDVTVILNSSLQELKKGVSEFGVKLRTGGKETVGLFYYAGHGLQSFGTNYLLPVDISLNDPADLDLVAVEASAVLKQMYSARNRTNIVILDACRNNPFDAIPEFGDNGLAEMRAPGGTFLSYATSPGEVALDGTGQNSPFSAALANELLTPGLPIELVFKQVRVSVLEKTNGRQIPWDTSSLTHPFYFSSPDHSSEQLAAERRIWETAKSSNDLNQLKLYLQTYPNGNFRQDAEFLITALTASEESSADALAIQSSKSNSMEKELIAKARLSGSIEDYTTYLRVYPDGKYAESAIAAVGKIQKELENFALDKIAATTQDSNEGNGDTGPEEVILLDQPIPSGYGSIQQKTIAELARGIASFPPGQLTGEEDWQNQSCNSCHLWTRDALCAQAKIYANTTLTNQSEGSHPYGGDFRKVLRDWGSGGCR